jgi:uncharacterized protein YggE
MKDKVGTLHVTGTGQVEVAPDEAVVHLVVLTEGATAAAAVASNAERTQATIAAVSSQPNHGVTTSGLSVSPIVNYDSGVGRIVGFRATNGVEVKTKVGYAGQVYDAGISGGANESSGITFRIQDETPHREEALRLAVKGAFRDAGIVAKAAKVELEGPDMIQINSGGGRVVYRSEALKAAAVTTPTIPEELTISASVQVQFQTRR